MLMLEEIALPEYPRIHSVPPDPSKGYVRRHPVRSRLPSRAN